MLGTDPFPSAPQHCIASRHSVPHIQHAASRLTQSARLQCQLPPTPPDGEATIPEAATLHCGKDGLQLSPDSTAPPLLLVPLPFLSSVSALARWEQTAAQTIDSGESIFDFDLLDSLKHQHVLTLPGGTTEQPSPP